jgi:ATP-binding cassette subfamily B protein/subfamily B ATP-binding cassette protein MsbA
LPYLRPYSALATLSIVVTVLSALAGLLSPWPLKILIDNALGDHPLPPILAGLLGSAAEDRFALLIFVVVAGLGVTLLQNGLAVFDEYVNTKIEQSMILDFRSDLFQHAQRLSLAFHDKRRSGQLIYAINSQGNAVARLTMAIPALGQSILMLLGMLWILLLIDPYLALLSLIVVPFLYHSVGYYATHIQERLRQVKSMEGEMLSIIHEAMSMLRVIAAFVREGYEHRRFRDQGERAVDARVNLTVRQTLFSLAVNTIIAVGTALVLGVGAYHVLQGKLTVGQLLVVMSYIAAVYQPLKTISATIGSLQDQLISLEIAFGLMDTEPEIKDAPGAVNIRRARGRVTFEGVCFGYGRGVDVLKDISFDAQPGRVIALVGPTGAGKTTVVSLVPRFYDPQQGRILLDGADIRTLTLNSLRQQISIVLQEPLLFAASIADNIRYGRLDASMSDIIEAAEAANAHDFIMRLPRKYETMVGERGAQLSGGERQRIAVARAFLKDAPILILDEPTSSIDSKTEAVILDALDRLMVGRTTFMVAHRLSTIRNADFVLVLNHGQLVQQGAHDDLVQRGGLYKQLYDAQTRQVQRKSPPLAQPLAARAPDGQG